MKTIPKGHVEGKDGIGRPRVRYIEQMIMDLKQKYYVSIRRLAEINEWRAASYQSSDCWL